jgi:dTDP-4-dehydrorhamnose 3,5-epimerase
MNVIETQLPGVFIIEPRIYRDDRGYFLETWSAAKYGPAALPTEFAQDNLSCSSPGVLRGLHYQFPVAQGKLVGVAKGEVFDVAVDIRVGSPTFGKWEGATLSAENGRQLYIPEGFAHGFLVLGDEPALFSYKCTRGYDPGGQCSILWDDPDLAIEWPGASPLLSPKDAEAPRLREVPESRLPRYQSGSST